MQTRPVLVLTVFIDALGNEIAGQSRFLEGLLPVRRPLATVFGYSSTCIPTILTGLPPREHGHFSSFYFAPERSPFGLARALDRLPPWLRDQGRVRALVSEGLRRWHGYDGYFALYGVPFAVLPYLDYTEKRDLYQPGGILSGAPTFLDHARRLGLPFTVSDWRLPEAANLAALEREVRRGEVAFAYLYLAALDARLHAEGRHGAGPAAMVRGYQATLERLLELARRRYREVRLHVFSDHGMADVTATCDLMTRVDGLGLTWGVDYAAVYDSTMARFWFFREHARQAILRALGEEPRGRVLDQATLEAWGCDFPGRRYGDLFFLMDPGVLILPSYMGRARLAGMHGYDPAHADSVAFFASSVEDLASPASLLDVHGLMVRELDLAHGKGRA
jgi:hypothetical protein